MNAPLLNRTATNRRDVRWACGLTVLGIAILYFSQWLQMPLYQDEVALRVLRSRFLVDGATDYGLFAQCASNIRTIAPIFWPVAWLYAAFDLAMHGPDAPEPMALWARMEGATLLGHVPGSMFPAGFSHVATGYGAGYYGYLWSEVVAADLRTAYANNRLDPVAGQRYRRTILANGSQVKPDELVRRFLSRSGNAQAFFEELQRGAN